MVAGKPKKAAVKEMVAYSAFIYDTEHGKLVRKVLRGHLVPDRKHRTGAVVYVVEGPRRGVLGYVVRLSGKLWWSTDPAALAHWNR